MKKQESIYEAIAVLKDEQLEEDGVWVYTFKGNRNMGSKTKVVKARGYSLDDLFHGFDMNELNSLTIKEI